VIPDNGERIKITDEVIFSTIAAAEEVHDPLDGLVEKTAENTLPQCNSTRRQFCLPSAWKPVKAAKAVVFQIANAEFITAVFTYLPKVLLRPYARSPATRNLMDG